MCVLSFKELFHEVIPISITFRKHDLPLTSHEECYYIKRNAFFACLPCRSFFC